MRMCVGMMWAIYWYPLCGYISRGRADASQFACFTEQAWSFSPPPPHVHAPCLEFEVFWLPTFAGQYSYISITFGIVNLFTIKAPMRQKRIAIFLQPINCVCFFLALQTELNTVWQQVLLDSQLSKGHKNKKFVCSAMLWILWWQQNQNSCDPKLGNHDTRWYQRRRWWWKTEQWWQWWSCRWSFDDDNNNANYDDDDYDGGSGGGCSGGDGCSRHGDDDDNTVTSHGWRALLRRRPEDDEGTQLGRQWNRTFIECKTRGYIGVVDSRIRHIRRLPDHAVARYRNNLKPQGSPRHESAQITKHNNLNTKRQTRFCNNTIW